MSGDMPWSVWRALVSRCDVAQEEHVTDIDAAQFEGDCLMTQTRYSMRDNALVIEVDAGIGDEVQFTKNSDGGLDIEIDEPWAGSTETGFGATTSITLTAADLQKFIAWLGDHGRVPA